MSWLRPEIDEARFRATKLLVGAFAFVYALVRLPYFGDFTGHDATSFAPVGVVRFLAAPLPSWATWPLAILAVAAAGAFTLGVRPRIVGPIAFTSLLWITTYASSFGKVLHTENLLVLHLGILAFASDRRFAIRLMTIATTLTYLVAGLTKLRHGGAAWLDGSALGDWLAFDALRKIELGSLSSPIAAWLAGKPALLVPLALFTLAVELSAPLALAGPRAGRTWAVAALTFHVAIVVTMAIGFYYPLSGVAFAAFFDPSRLPIVRRVIGRAWT